MVMSGVRALLDRVSTLDGPAVYADRHTAASLDIAHFIRTLDSITPVRPGAEPGNLLLAIAESADRTMANCRLLRRLEQRMREVVDGPLLRSRQYWVATTRPLHLSSRKFRPQPTHFIAPDEYVGEPTAKPFAVGMYTATGTHDMVSGMWRAYLELHRTSTLFPRPWQVWRMPVKDGAEIMEIGSAVEWVRFVCSNPLQRGRYLYPDWNRIAATIDGVHMSLRAVAATEGLWFLSSENIIAAPYWGVESTLWLRWSFERPELAESVSED